MGLQGDSHVMGLDLRMQALTKFWAPKQLAAAASVANHGNCGLHRNGGGHGCWLICNELLLIGEVKSVQAVLDLSWCQVC